MVALISQAKLNSLNIDTVERAIVLAALALRTAVVGIDNVNTANDRIKITTEEKGLNQVNLKLNIFLPINSYRVNKFGGKIIYALEEFEIEPIDLELSLNLTVSPSPTQASFGIPVYQNLPQTFETYLYYYASILYASLEDNRNEIIRITPRDTSFFRSEVQLRIILPIDAKKWALGNNLIDSVHRVVTTDYVGVSEFVILAESLSFLFNSTTLSNNHILTN
jgi:hypothetical protein